jgi:valyl-tRNA synthetase
MAVFNLGSLRARTRPGTLEARSYFRVDPRSGSQKDVKVQGQRRCVRYWAASARLGTDAAFDEGQMKIGRRLAIKLLNAARFALSFELPAGVTTVTEAIDKSMLASLQEVIAGSTQAFESYDHTKALEKAESFFWTFTDDYLELVKERAYGQGDFTEQEKGSAVIALRQALGVLVRLFAPFIPFAAEEVWSWWQDGTVHKSSWPTSDEISGEDAGLMILASAALVQIRKSKSDNKLSMKAEIATALVSGPVAMQSMAKDLAAVGHIAELRFADSKEVTVTELRFLPDQD